jgi:hypothetical protein
MRPTTANDVTHRLTSNGVRLEVCAPDRPRRGRVWLLAILCVALTPAPVVIAARHAGGARGQAERTPPALAAAPPPLGLGDGTAPATPTRVRMREVDFYVDPEVVLHIRRLEGTMRSKAGGPVVFDDKRSFVLHIDAAEVALTTRDLGALLNKYVFGYKGAPLSHLSVSTSGAELVQRGRLRKGVSLPFEIHSRVSVTADGRIRLHPTKTRILGVNGAALLGALHLSLEKLVDLRGARGATVKGNDILLNPDSILPPPTIEGRLTAISVEPGRLVQLFGGDRAPATRASLVPPDSAAPSYMYYKGGTLRFGRLVMLDAEMQIVDLDRASPFKFDLDRYTAQLVAGYSKTLPDSGLEVHMRDVDAIGDASPAAAAASRGTGPNDADLRRLSLGGRRPPRTR